MTAERARNLELGFAAVFSAVIICVFFSAISMNGLVLGNDPAVHLEKAQVFLQTHNISLANLGWTPPLYQILLVAFISFTGAASLEQMIFIVKIVAVIIDWLFFFSVYLLGSKFFGRKIGIAGAVLLLMAFPIFEVNLWGGYTTVLGLAFMSLLLLYFPLSVKGFGPLVVTSLTAFSLVLSHQLATFVTVLVLPPVMLYMLLKSRGKYLGALVALILGGGAAFFLYYFQAMMPYLDVLIEHVLFSQRTTLYQIPATTLNSFMVNFGFIFFASIVGLFVSFKSLRNRREPVLFLILLFSFVVPFVLAESYLFGLFLPFQWFIYYLMPSMIILAAVFAVFIFNKVSDFYLEQRHGLRKQWLKVATVTLIILVASTAVFRLATVYSKITEASIYYSTSDPKALDAGMWLRTFYPANAALVVTEVPGFWFKLFSGKNVTAATNPIIQRNQLSESVLDLSYELEHPLTLVRAYEAKGGISDESFVSINHVWNLISYSDASGDKVVYRENEIDKEVGLDKFIREISYEGGENPKIEIDYVNDALKISKTIIMRNGSAATDIIWNVSALKAGISNVSLYTSIHFYLQFSFLKAYVPGVLNWDNPWTNPSDSWTNASNPSDTWAAVNFSDSTLTGNQLVFLDTEKKVTYAIELERLPEWGNVGALGNHQIDASRFQYDLGTLGVNETVSVSYHILTFSESSIAEVQAPTDVNDLFRLAHFASLNVTSRDYHDYIRDGDIKFLVYDRNQLDTKIIRSNLLELVYSNDRYVIFEIKSIESASQ